MTETETVNGKALRLIATGKVLLRRYDEDLIHADVEGDNGNLAGHPVIVIVGETALCAARHHILAVMAEARHIQTGASVTALLADDGYSSIRPDLGAGT